MIIKLSYMDRIIKYIYLDYCCNLNMFMMGGRTLWQKKVMYVLI